MDVHDRLCLIGMLRQREMLLMLLEAVVHARRLKDIALVAASVIEPFDTPRGLKCKLELDVSRRTIDRRLIEANLFGRVAAKKRKFTEEGC